MKKVAKDEKKEVDIVNVIESVVKQLPVLQQGLMKEKRRTKLVRIMETKSLLPFVTIKGDQLFYENRCLNLRRRPLTLKLFQAFKNDPLEKLTRVELAKRVYECKEFDQRSSFYRETLMYNAVKLVSRARRLAKYGFGQDCYVDWFPYDEDEQVWKLYNLKLEYFVK